MRKILKNAHVGRLLIVLAALFSLGGVAAPAGATTLPQPTGTERATVTLTRSRASAAHCVVQLSFGNGRPLSYYRLVGGETPWASYRFQVNRSGNFSYGFVAQKALLVGVQPGDIDFYFLGADPDATPADPIPVSVRLVNRCIG